MLVALLCMMDHCWAGFLRKPLKLNACLSDALNAVSSRGAPDRCYHSLLIVFVVTHHIKIIILKKWKSFFITINIIDSPLLFIFSARV